MRSARRLEMPAITTMVGVVIRVAITRNRLSES